MARIIREAPALSLCLSGLPVGMASVGRAMPAAGVSLSSQRKCASGILWTIRPVVCICICFCPCLVVRYRIPDSSISGTIVIRIVIASPLPGI